MYTDEYLDSLRAEARSTSPENQIAYQLVITLAEAMNAEDRQEEAERRAREGGVVTQDSDQLEQFAQASVEASPTVNDDDNTGLQDTDSAEPVINGSGFEPFNAADFPAANDAIDAVDAVEAFNDFNLDALDTDVDHLFLEADGFIEQTANEAGMSQIAATSVNTPPSVNNNDDAASHDAASTEPVPQIANEAADLAPLIYAAEHDSANTSRRSSVGSGTISPSTAQTTPPLPSVSPVMSDAANSVPAAWPQPDPRPCWQNSSPYFAWKPPVVKPAGKITFTSCVAPAQAAFKGVPRYTQAHVHPLSTPTMRTVGATPAAGYPRPYKTPYTQKPNQSAARYTSNQLSSGGLAVKNNASGSMPAAVRNTSPTSIPSTWPNTTSNGWPLTTSTGWPTTTSTCGSRKSNATSNGWPTNTSTLGSDGIPTVMRSVIPAGTSTTSPIVRPTTNRNGMTPASMPVLMQVSRESQNNSSGMQQRHTPMPHNVPPTDDQIQQWAGDGQTNTSQTSYANPGFNSFNDVSLMGQYQHNTQPAPLGSHNHTHNLMASQGITCGFQQLPMSSMAFQSGRQYKPAGLQAAQYDAGFHDRMIQMRRDKVRDLQNNMKPTPTTHKPQKRALKAAQTPSNGTTQPPAKKVRLQRPPAGSITSAGNVVPRAACTSQLGNHSSSYQAPDSSPSVPH